MEINIKEMHQEGLFLEIMLENMFYLMEPWVLITPKQEILILYILWEVQA